MTVSRMMKTFHGESNPLWVSFEPKFSVRKRDEQKKGEALTLALNIILMQIGRTAKYLKLEKVRKPPLLSPAFLWLKMETQIQKEAYPNVEDEVSGSVVDL